NVVLDHPDAVPLGELFGPVRSPLRGDQPVGGPAGPQQPGEQGLTHGAGADDRDGVHVVSPQSWDAGWPAGQPPGPAAQLPKKPSASVYRSSGTVFSSRVPSLRGTRTISVPRKAIIVPQSPSCTASMACSPNRVASTRSNADGVPPRWMWPSTTV